MGHGLTRSSIAATKRKKAVHVNVHVYVDVVVDVEVNGLCHVQILSKRTKIFDLLVRILQESRIQKRYLRIFWILDPGFLCLSVNRTCGIE